MYSDLQEIPQWKDQGGLVHGFTTKRFGNMSFRCGDRYEVRSRRGRLAAELKVSVKDLLFLPLSHSNKVLSLPRSAMVQRDEHGSYSAGGHLFLPTVGVVHHNDAWQAGLDSVVTDNPEILPIILPADCPVLGCFDSKRRVCALAHLGLIGTVNKLAISTVQCMVQEYKCDPSNIEAVIFPSIRKCHYDLTASGVWTRIKGDVENHYNGLVPFVSEGMCDLQSEITSQLISCDLAPSKIHDINCCTVCHSELFFSNFAASSPELKKHEGRFAAFMGIKYVRDPN